MPNTESAKRALRKAERRRLRNRPQRSALRTLVKKVRTLAANGNVEGAKAALQLVIKRLDQAADKHLIHKNAAARKKSRLAQLVNKAAQKGTDTGAAQPSST
jgi:small subunit ribosomal protein S20